MASPIKASHCLGEVICSLFSFLWILWPAATGKKTQILSGHGANRRYKKRRDRVDILHRNKILCLFVYCLEGRVHGHSKHAALPIITKHVHDVETTPAPSPPPGNNITQTPPQQKCSPPTPAPAHSPFPFPATTLTPKTTPLPLPLPLSPPRKKYKQKGAVLLLQQLL